MSCAFDLASSLCGDDQETSACPRWLYLKARNLILSRRCCPGVERVAAESLDRRTISR
jgi:hypothetical protein